MQFSPLSPEVLILYIGVQKSRQFINPMQHSAVSTQHVSKHVQRGEGVKSWKTEVI
jgi:hypothetical protein